MIGMTAEQKLKLIERYVREEFEAEEMESMKYDAEEEPIRYYSHAEKYRVLHDMLQYIVSLNDDVEATEAEQKLIRLHKENYSGIRSAEIVDAWRDEDGYLCVRYDNEEWYHYNAVDGAWW